LSSRVRARRRRRRAGRRRPGIGVAVVRHGGRDFGRGVGVGSSGVGGECLSAEEAVCKGQYGKGAQCGQLTAAGAASLDAEDGERAPVLGELASPAASPAELAAPPPPPLPPET